MALEPHSQVAWSYPKSNHLYKGKNQASTETQGEREEVAEACGNREIKLGKEEATIINSNQVVPISKCSMFKKAKKEVLVEVWQS